MKKFFIFLFTFILFCISVLLYATFIGTMGFVTKEYVLYNDNLPSPFDGLKIVHFSDLHYGRAISLEKVQDIINEINLINADIVVFTGDLLDKDIEINDTEYDLLVKSFSNINARYGKYAVLGNHDYLNLDKIVKLYNDSGFIYLENEKDIITNKNGDSISILGIGNVSYHLDDLDVAIKSDEDNLSYKIILVHEPDISDEIINNYDVNLILAGHSHNGQIRLPFIGALYTPNNAKKYYDEYYKVNETYIYISSGIGVSNINMRLFNKPSINFYRINKK